MDTRNKQLIGVCLLVGIGLAISLFLLTRQEAQPLGAPTLTDAEIIAYIEQYEQIRQGNGRYREHPKATSGKYEYWVNEYLSDAGMGYEVVIVRTNAGGSQDVRQIATGPEALQRTFNWRPYVTGIPGI